MALPINPRLRFRAQANTRVPAAVVAILRVGKMVHVDAERDDCLLVLQQLKDAMAITERALKRQVFEEHAALFELPPDVDQDDSDDDAEEAAPVEAAADSSDDSNPFE